MSTNGVNNINYDGSCSKIRWHLSAFSMLSLDLPEQTKKQEKIAPLGQTYSTIRTPGIMETGDAVATFTAVQWKYMLGRLPDNYMEIEFPITTREATPGVTADYSTILDRCKIIKQKGGKIENKETGRIIEVTLSVIMVHERGEDGIWKTAARRPGEASAAARALMF